MNGDMAFISEKLIFLSPDYGFLKADLQAISTVKTMLTVDPERNVSTVYAILRTHSLAIAIAVAGVCN